MKVVKIINVIASILEAIPALLRMPQAVIAKLSLSNNLGIYINKLSANDFPHHLFGFVEFACAGEVIKDEISNGAL